MTKVGNGNYASALVVQPDGKLVAAGAADRTVLALVRYRADGTLDPSFGDGGTVVTTAARGSGLAIQRDRKLVTVGTGRGRSGRNVFVLARFLEDGSFDASFGRGGKLLTAFPFPRKAVANAVVVGRRQDRRRRQNRRARLRTRPLHQQRQTRRQLWNRWQGGDGLRLRLRGPWALTALTSVESGDQPATIAPVETAQPAKTATIAART